MSTTNSTAGQSNTVTVGNTSVTFEPMSVTVIHDGVEAVSDTAEDVAYALAYVLVSADGETDSAATARVARLFEGREMRQALEAADNGIADAAAGQHHDGGTTPNVAGLIDVLTSWREASL